MKNSINWLIAALVFVCLESKAQVQLSLANRNIPAQVAKQPQTVAVTEIEITQEQMDSMDAAEGLKPAPSVLSPVATIFEGWEKIFTPKKVNMNAFNIRVDTTIEKQIDRPLSDFSLANQKGEAFKKVSDAELDQIEDDSDSDYKTDNVEPDAFPISEVEAYILRHIKYADEAEQQYKIPSCITIAQGILESRHGQSKMAKETNNQFGIKCRGGNGCGKKGHDKYYKDDKPHEAFRCYPDAEGSFQDHSKFLRQNDRYDDCFECNGNIDCWLAGLDRAGYATDGHYGEKLAQLINKYKLHNTPIQYNRKAYFAKK